jgi:hypothetical protein
MIMKKLLLLTVLLLMSAGCATAPYVPVEDTHKAKILNCTVELPKGWMRENQENFILVTRDGKLLQHIAIYRVSVTEPLKFTKKTLQKNMLPQELAEVALDDISSNPALVGVKIDEKEPATISGIPGFRASYSYKTRDGLRVRSVSYGFLKDEWFYTIRYTAAARHYFDRDLPTFQTVYQSFRLE